MKKLQYCLCAAALGCVSALTAHADVTRLNPRDASSSYRPDELIVKFKSSSNVSMLRTRSGAFATSQVDNIDRVFKKIGVKEAESLMPLTENLTFTRAQKAYNGKTVTAAPVKKTFVLKLDAESLSIPEAIETLRELDEVEYAEPNYLVYALETGDPDDSYYDLQYGLRDIRMPDLWKMPIISKEGPVIAILDTGVDISHPDLKANVWTNSSEAAGATGYDDDKNGFVDDLHGWDFINKSGDIQDYNGHGTHCAGIAAACGFNGIGIIGACPDARIMPVTVMQSNGTGDVATIIRGLDYAVANGADIISMSLGSYSNSMAYEDALARAYQSAVIVAAAGNDGVCLNHDHPERGQMAPMPMFPAAYTFVLGVQASAPGGGLAGFSNYDDNGPTYSAYGEEKLYNYEVTVPGASIMSTYPGGGYKTLNGTSMATPLVAGAVARLLQAKEYGSKEELFGDLIHSVTDKGNLDIAAAYALSDANRTPEIQFVTIEMADADGDGRADAGEVVEFYPVIRNSWGSAKNIKYKVEYGETGNNNTFDILEDAAEFGLTLSAYGKARALNPVKLKFHDDVADGRIVRLRFTAEADNAADIEQELEVKVENAVELSGVLREDTTLTPDQHYVVTGTFGVPEGVTLTILPGTTIKFRDNSKFAVDGTIIADGEPGKMITFTKADHDLGIVKPIDFGNNNISYCEFYDFHTVECYIIANKASHCILRDSRLYYAITSTGWENSSFYNLTPYGLWISDKGLKNSNIIRCSSGWPYLPRGGNAKETINNQSIQNNNIFGISAGNYTNLSFAIYSDKIQTFRSPLATYAGTGRMDIAKTRVIDINHELANTVKTLAEYDFSNLPERPSPEAPGLVWKVLVNGYDAQDEFEAMPALGIGRHKFEVYFNRPMNKAVSPLVAMGVRPPYTAISIGEDGEWRTEMLPYSPLGKGKGITNVTNGDFTGGNGTGWKSSGGNVYGNPNSTTYIGFDGECLYSSSHQTGVPNKLYQEINGAQNGRYKLTISAKVNKLAENNNCQYVYLNDSKVYLDERALNGTVYEVIADVRDNFIEVGIAQTENISSSMFIDNVNLTLLEEYSNERLIPTDIYTAYLTITGKSSYDGLNRIYVADAEDDEYFKIPVEDMRFNVMVQAAGSLSDGFMAEGGLGRVNLSWENAEDEIDDMLGLNMYRYEIDSEGHLSDTICVNRQIIEPKVTEYTDYDVIPRHTYGYFYKMMRTDLAETSPSKTVAVTLATATEGDANGSGSVDVADVITTVNYASGMSPKPFIFEAADMNSDTEIDILDVVGIIRTILNPEPDKELLSLVEPEATYYISEDGVLYIDCPVGISGVQLNLAGGENCKVTGDAALEGFEQTGATIGEDDYIFMAFNLHGKYIEPGLHPIARISDGVVRSIKLSDTAGRNIIVTEGAGGNGSSNIREVTIDGGKYGKGIYTITGVKLSDDASALKKLPKGVYIVNGQKVVNEKAGN